MKKLLENTWDKMYYKFWSMDDYAVFQEPFFISVLCKHLTKRRLTHFSLYELSFCILSLHIKKNISHNHRNHYKNISLCLSGASTVFTYIHGFPNNSHSENGCHSSYCMGGMDDIENTLPPYGVSFWWHILGYSISDSNLKDFIKPFLYWMLFLAQFFCCSSHDSFGLIPLRGRVTQ